nr:MAG TPA: putative 2OG-Fe(II) oxygenase [Caudoviricetes sp.]
MFFFPSYSPHSVLNNSSCISSCLVCKILHI